MLKKLWSLKLLAIILIISGLSNIIANDKPLMVGFEGKVYFPAFKSYSETDFGGVFEIMVKAMKRALKTTIGRADLDEEEFRKN